jgi:outer membrane protein OmpA-like peptidoglycan-associated protein
MGYTSNKEGTPQSNMQLSLNRAKSVADILINKFGIDKSRLTVETIGGVSPFSEESMNHCVISVR